MNALLAQQQVQEVPPSTVPFMEAIRNWQMPSQPQYLDYLQAAGIVQAALLLAVGVVYLIYGWKIFRILVVVNAAVLGALLGTKIGSMLNLQGSNMPLFGAIAISLLFAVLALPLMKYAVSLMGALAGSLLGYSVWHYVCRAANAPELGNSAWVGALIGLVTLGLLAFIIFRIVIIIFTAFQGALFTSSGILGVLMQWDAFRTSLLTSLRANPYLLPMLVLVPAIIGFAFQHAYFDKKGAAKKPAPAGDKGG